MSPPSHFAVDANGIMQHSCKLISGILHSSDRAPVGMRVGGVALCTWLTIFGSISSSAAIESYKSNSGVWQSSPTPSSDRRPVGGGCIKGQAISRRVIHRAKIIIVTYSDSTIKHYVKSNKKETFSIQFIKQLLAECLDITTNSGR